MVLARHLVDVFERHVPIIATAIVSVVGVAVFFLSNRGLAQRAYYKGAVRYARPIDCSKSRVPQRTLSK